VPKGAAPLDSGVGVLIAWQVLEVETGFAQVPTESPSLPSPSWGGNIGFAPEA